MRAYPTMVMALVVVAAACASEALPANPTSAQEEPTTSTRPGTSGASPENSGPVDAFGDPIPPAPPYPDGPLDPQVVADLDAVFADLRFGADLEALRRIGDSGDTRVAWLLADLLRFFQGGNTAGTAIASFERLTITDLPRAFVWGTVTDWLIAWDIPAPPGYLDWKRRPFEIIEPAWAPFFDDDDADVDWRHLSWGGVLIDDRPLDAVGAPCPEGCIPALDDPAVTDAAGGSWYADDAYVFGIVIDGEARAYPKNIMEVHEMVNDTVGGRRVGIPYCTLCGSAQGYFTDAVPAGFDTIELRTTGLLSRSNKVMFDLNTFSLFDTFTGKSLSGPLQDERFELEMFTVFTSTWAEWKATHPDTTIVARDGGIGRSYPDDPLGGRDDNGPIFPVGDVDPRLPVQQQVLGVVTPEGEPVAFPVEAAALALADGSAVRLAGVEVHTDGAGFSATFAGEPVAAHQAFWFAWSQFHPGTLLWTPLSAE